MVIDLREATLELEEGGGGWLSYADGIYGGYTIANGVVIENATGGSGDDAIVGNAADNVLTGGAGADTFIFVEGQGGYDVITDYERGVDRFDFSDYGVFRVFRNLEVDATADGLEVELLRPDDTARRVLLRRNRRHRIHRLIRTNCLTARALACLVSRLGTCFFTPRSILSGVF